MSIESMPSNHLILCRLLLLLPSIFPSIRVFSNELALHIRWPKFWSLEFNYLCHFHFQFVPWRQCTSPDIEASLGKDATISWVSTKMERPGGGGSQDLHT